MKPAISLTSLQPRRLIIPPAAVGCKPMSAAYAPQGLLVAGGGERRATTFYSLDVVGNRLPAVGVNFNNITLFPLSFGFPPPSVFMHPGIDKLTIVGWQSPINGRIRITGSFGDLDPTCGDGVLWSIDKGRNTLRSGDLPNGGAEDFAAIST